MRLHTRPCPKHFGRHDDQLLPAINLAGDVIWQTAIRKGNIRAALKDIDFRGFIHAAGPGGGRSASRHATDDDDSTGSIHKSHQSMVHFTTAI